MRKLGQLSNRVKKNTGSQLAPERYNWLSLENAEPDFGFPTLDNSVIGSDSDGTRKFFNTDTNSTANTLVFRDSAGDFSANVITVDSIRGGTTLVIDPAPYVGNTDGEDPLTGVVEVKGNLDVQGDTTSVKSLNVNNGAAEISSTGEVTSGSWKGDSVQPEYGGTGAGAGGVTNNAVLYGQGTSPMAEATGTAHQVFQLDSSGVPIFANLDAGNY